MRKYRIHMLWLGLIFILALAVFSAVGAFKGTAWSQKFFNSIPLSVFWTLFATLIGVSIFTFPRLLKKPALLSMHAGCVLIIAGAMWGSAGGHEFQRKYLNLDKVTKGNIAIIENSEHDIVYKDSQTLYDHYFNRKTEGIDDSKMHKLPFRIKLNDFRIDHYDSGRLVAQIEENVVASEMFKIGNSIQIGENFATITPLKVYDNLKIKIENGKTSGYEDQGPGENPAVEVLAKFADGREIKKFIYEKFPDFNSIESIKLKYFRTISDYISQLEIIKDGKIVHQKDIEVNSPLYYGGYHFYQSSYQQLSNGQYATILSVTSDSGLYCVFAGFFLLCGGIIWHQWLRHFFKKNLHTS